jgi:catechol 2,3-dioxygenase-like lactoylglutathione lyase family enzyme
VKFNALIPEFAVTDIGDSLAFYVDRLGFRIDFERQVEGFAFISLGGAQLMLDQIDLGRTFETAVLEHPLGRGCNLMIEIAQSTLDAMLSSLADAGIELFLPVEERWYAQDAKENGVRQFAVTDPDGYLLRFSSGIGTRDMIS